MKRTYVAENLYFSSLFGRGIYQADIELVPDPLAMYDRANVSPLLINVITGERFYIKKVNCRGDELDRYIDEIMHPVSSRDMCWPCDMVLLDDSLSADTGLLVANRYPQTGKEESCNYGLLFHYDRIPQTVPWKTAVKQVVSDKRADLGTKNGRNWKNPHIRNLSVSMASTLSSINRSGYAYCDFHESRMFITSGGAPEVYFDFSNLIFSTKLLAHSPKIAAFSPKEGEYPIEFAEPAYVRGKQSCFDVQTQNYNLCAFFFHLFYGRYAYYGNMHPVGIIDGDIYTFFRKYYELPPIFIFDPEDKGNALGLFDDTEEQAAISLWEDTPASLQNLFIKTLKRENADRRDTSDRPINVSNPTPEEWLKCFDELGWHSGEQTRGETLNGI